jgi:hypothetical protein
MTNDEWRVRARAVFRHSSFALSVTSDDEILLFVTEAL